MSARPYFEDQWCDDYAAPEPPEPEENVVCVCDNCEEDIFDGDEMAVIEDHSYTTRPRIMHICMDCWKANGWNKAEELFDMIGVWYWTGDAVDAVKIGGAKLLEMQSRYKRMIGIAADMGIAAVSRKENA